MTRSFRSNGKVLITGEYLVLEGAKSFALPTVFGQKMKVTPIELLVIEWKSYTHNRKLWFAHRFSILEIIQGTSAFKNIEEKVLYKILHTTSKMNPHLLQNNNGFAIETYLEFPKNWGLGTSSTLINNIAQWAKIDAYQLLWKSFSGSGYDIACAQNNTAIIYTLTDNKPEITPQNFYPEFKNQLFFVYLNQKQNSREAIAWYQKNNTSELKPIEEISAITEEILHCTTLACFNRYIERHEKIMSKLLQIPTVKQRRFPDFLGSIKSLGAWGGDFILVTGEYSEMTYFKKKGYTTIFSYDQLIKVS